MIDLYSRRLLGAATSRHPDADLACAALEMAVAARGGRNAIWCDDEAQRVIFHTDRGSTYTAKDFRRLCSAPSSASGSRWDGWGRVSTTPPPKRSCPTGHSAVDSALQRNIDYLDHAREVDIPSISGPRRDPERLRRLLTSLARNTATEVKISALSRETLGDNETALARTTIYDYLAALERLMLIEDVPAWSTHLRSRATLRQEPKRHFVDPSLAVAALASTPKRLLDGLGFGGFLFESLIVRDLRVLSSPLRGTVAHYRDSNGVEVDVILQIPDGTWGAFEVKLGPGRIDDAAAALLRFASTIDTQKAGEPAVLGVITTATYGYTRKDGIQVIPVAALRP